MAQQHTEYIRRFGAFPRFLHFLVIISFLTLAVTGMILKFASEQWAVVAADVFGSFVVLGILHRLCAVITFVYFMLNFILMYQNWMKSGESLIEFLLNKETSLVPLPHDLIEMIGTSKWFFGLGPMPNYGRWTYWEKFDFFAVFWGVGVIGLSGLALWFPEEATMLFPGYWLNVATIIHSDEALLASGFIFTIHFFNTHLRPEKFPLDPVIFTGVMPLDELKHERPREYDYWVGKGKLDDLRCDPPPRWFHNLAHLFGFTALSIGLSLVVAIIYSMYIMITHH